MLNEQLAARIQAGVDEADNMLLLWQQNEPFIRMMGRRFAGPGKAELEDLMQEGYLALCEAVRHYDIDQEVPFISYAAFWIKQGMKRYIENCCGTVRIPTHARDWVRRYRKMTAEYCKYYGSEPGDDTLCALLQISRAKLQAVRKSADMEKICSLSEPLGQVDGGLDMEETIASGEDLEEDAVRRLDYQNMKSMLWEAVDGLEEKQAEVIRCRFQDQKTLRETGEAIGITKDAAAHQQNNALRLLGQPSRCRRYRGYYEEYLAASCYHHVGLEAFNRTWTSEVEREALR